MTRGVAGSASTCNVDGCLATHYGRGMCRSHYRSWAYVNKPGFRAGRIEAARRTKIRRFGIEPGEYDQIKDLQGGRCAICGGVDAGRDLAVDHDHACCPSGARACGDCVRGLLCLQCNTKLGWFEKFGEQIVEYLDRGGWGRSTRRTRGSGTTEALS